VRECQYDFSSVASVKDATEKALRSTFETGEKSGLFAIILLIITFAVALYTRPRDNFRAINGVFSTGAVVG
jgi:hypothetical protein